MSVVVRVFLVCALCALFGLALGKRLDPRRVPKFLSMLRLPGTYKYHGRKHTYRVELRPSSCQMLPPSFPKTPVFAYGDPRDEKSFVAPSWTFETRQGEAVSVLWRNALSRKDEDDEGEEEEWEPVSLKDFGMTIDTTLHWGDPRVKKGARGEEYDGPIPLVTHLHGAVAPSAVDGHPDAWNLPKLRKDTDKYVQRGPKYFSVDEVEEDEAFYVYPNTEHASAHWYHPHSLGITRLLVYMNAAGLYVVRDRFEDALKLPRGEFEVPLILRDASFNEDGTLFYPSNITFNGYHGKVFPDSPVPPSWVPEFYGDTILVNSAAWPVHQVQKRRYRFRVLNGAQARFFLLSLSVEGAEGVTSLPMWLIGTDGGLRNSSALQMESVLMSPAERVDLIVDFTDLPRGSKVVMRNRGPDGPLGDPRNITDPADPETTGLVMQFLVEERVGVDDSAKPQDLVLPNIEPLHHENSRELILKENTYNGQPTMDLIGTEAEGPLLWDSPITERPTINTTEMWSYSNLTPDSHPIHLHLVFLQIVSRQKLNGTELEKPWPQDLGWKDTFVAWPGYKTNVVAWFGPYEAIEKHPYVHHCHIVEHEDNEMMRNFIVVPRK